MIMYNYNHESRVNSKLQRVPTAIREAFESLRKNGISALEGFCYTQSSAWAAAPYGNVCFYTEQSLDCMEQYGNITIAWRSEDESPILGQKIVEVMQSHGLQTEWDGSVDKCIKVYIP